MKYTSYVDEFSKSFLTILNNMAGIKADRCDIKTEGYENDVCYSPYSVVVPFNDSVEGIVGEFVLSIRMKNRLRICPIRLRKKWDYRHPVNSMRWQRKSFSNFGIRWSGRP